ncbi:MAG: ATPase [Chloroflexi bacterium]|nr:ATPase [Chloroflexota bacterium]
MIFGVDVGGTKTLAVICDMQGHVLAQSQFGEGNWEGIGLDAAAILYAETVETMCGLAGVSPSHIQASAWGIAGLDWPSDDSRLRPLIQPLFSEIPLTLVNDAFLPLRAGARHPYGVGVIAGTGSTVAGIGIDGTRARNFGLGSMWGGFDGASHLAYEAMRKASDAYFGRRVPTLLSPALCAWGGVKSIAELAEGVSRGEIVKDIATFAPTVMMLAQQGDTAAYEIIADAAHILADNALAVIQSLHMAAHDFDVVLAGGVAVHATDDFYRLLRTAIHQEAPHASIVRLQHKPVVGALLLAFDSVVDVIDDAVVQRVRTEV